LGILREVNLALISVPGEFAAEEARKALRKNLHVMLFSDNVSVEDECSLKEEARERGLLVMGPDCGTAIIGGVPLAFANEVPAGNVGIVSASGTGLQEVSSIIARGGMGISHGIGVGGRDLSEAVGGLMTMMAFDALDEDPGTKRIILISKPPSQKIAGQILERAAKSSKQITICFLGNLEMELPPNVKLAPTLMAAAEDVLGVSLPPRKIPQRALSRNEDPKRRWIRGLFSGGTLCAEAQVVLQRAGEKVYSNAPIPGAENLNGEQPESHILLDLGTDEYTVGRPHPMIDPSVRTEHFLSSMDEPGVAVVLLDVVIGYGSHEDPAEEIAAALRNVEDRNVCVVASVCGTEGDPQGYSAQVEKLEEAGVLVASSAAQAADLAFRITQAN
jgi:succinyl-CoA synthetase alpha subunit